MTKESRLLKNTGIIAIGNICTKCVSFLLLPLYTSILTTEEYGTVDLINTYVTLLAVILTLQFEQALFRFLIEARENNGNQSKYITTALISVVLLNVVAAVLMSIVLFAIKLNYAPFVIVWTVLTSLSAMFLQIPRGMGDNVTYAAGGFVSGTTQVVLNVIFIAVLRMGIQGMLLANVISCAISVLFISIKLRIWRFLSIHEFDKSSFNALLKYSLPLIPYTLCWWVISASDRQIISMFMGTDANGIYSLAYKFPSIFTLVTGIFQTAWGESAAENYETDNDQKYYDSMVNRTIRFYSSGNLIIIAAIPLVFSLLVKKDFVLAYNYIPILMTSSLLHAVSALYGSIYFAFKKTKEVSWTVYISAILNVVINLLLIRKIGLYAAALSTLVAYIVAVIIRHIDIQKYVKITSQSRYLVVEAVAYMVALTSYYSRNFVVQIVVLFALIPYCAYQNKEALRALLDMMKRK